MKDDTGFTCFGLFVAFVALIALSAALNGWVVSVMWGWFVAPTFGVPQITVLQSIGLGLVVGMFTTRGGSGKNDDGDKLTSAIAYAIGTPLFTLFLGWIVYSLM